MMLYWKIYDISAWSIYRYIVVVPTYGRCRHDWKRFTCLWPIATVTKTVGRNVISGQVSFCELFWIQHNVWGTNTISQLLIFMHWFCYSITVLVNRSDSGTGQIVCYANEGIPQYGSSRPSSTHRVLLITRDWTKESSQSPTKRSLYDWRRV